MSPPGPSNQLPPLPYPQYPSHPLPHPQYPSQHQQPHHPYQYGPQGPYPEHMPLPSSQSYIPPYPHYQYYPAPIGCTYPAHSLPSSFNQSHSHTYPSALLAGPVIHPASYRTLADASLGELPPGGTSAVPSPLFGVKELHDHTSRPPTRSSLGAHSRCTSTSTIPSVHSAGSEYQPTTAKAAPRKAAAKGKAKAPAGNKKRGASSTGNTSRPPTQPEPTRASSRPHRKPKPAHASLSPAPPSPSPPIDEDDEESTYPPSNITCKNVEYPILDAPIGTTYSVNNFVVLIPADYAPPGTDIIASEYEQYSCRLCRKTYSGKNARSVARRHLQDKHAVRLELQERRSRWDRNSERPKDEAEKNERNRANKAEWARKHRQAERERIEAALQRGQKPTPTRPKRGKNKAVTSTTTSTAAAKPLRSRRYDPSATLNSIAAMSSGSLSDIDVDTDVDEVDDGASPKAGANADGDTSCETTLAILRSSWDRPADSAGCNANLDPSLRPGAPSHRTESQSPLSSSPDLAVLGAHQQWAVPEGWVDMSANQMISWMTFPPDEGGEGDAIAKESAEGDGEMSEPTLKPTALAAETLLNLHSSPSHPTFPPRPALQARPTPLRRFTLGSSSSSALIPTSSALSIIAEPNFSGWPTHTPRVQGLETPISLRVPIPKSRWEQNENDLPIPAGQAGEGRRRPMMRGRLAAGERSLSFSAALPLRAGMGMGMDEDDPFAISPGLKQNDESEKRGMKRGGDGSPVPIRKRQPLNIIMTNPPSSYHTQSQFQPQAHQPLSSQTRHHPSSSSSLSSTLVGPHTHIPQTISPLKRQALGGVATPISRRAPGAAGSRFGQALFGRTPARDVGSGMGIGIGMGMGSAMRIGQEGRDGREERWALSSPAGSGMAAELGLVGSYGYVEGLETPMRGVVESETPARE